MKNITTIEQLAIKHDYYCSESNYYSNEPGDNYQLFSEFYDNWFEADVDMNLCFRWDIRKSDNGNYYSMEVFIIQQRKGIFYPIFIESVFDNDVPKILEYLKKHQKTLKQIWKPL